MSKSSSCRSDNCRDCNDPSCNHHCHYIQGGERKEMIAPM